MKIWLKIDLSVILILILCWLSLLACVVPSVSLPKHGYQSCYQHSLPFLFLFDCACISIMLEWSWICFADHTILHVQPSRHFVMMEASTYDQVRERSEDMRYKTLNRKKAHQFNHLRKLLKNLGDFIMAAKILVQKYGDFLWNARMSYFKNLSPMVRQSEPQLPPVVLLGQLVF